jgi:hypothetical protein
MMAALSLHGLDARIHMHDPHILMVMDAALAIFVAADLMWTLHTGRARGRFGTITRKSRPARFWRYVCADYAMLALCIATFASIALWPNFFR